MLVVGDKEKQAESVAVRQHKKGDLGAIPLRDFHIKLQKEITQKLITAEESSN